MRLFPLALGALFAAILWFSALWLLDVHAPTPNWVWGSGIMATWGAMDFAGGIVVHATAGSATLVCALVVGKRGNFPQSLHPPHSPILTMIGASMLWIGWFGFNGGLGLADGVSAASQFGVQLLSVAITTSWTVLASYVILRVIRVVIGLLVDQQDEIEGLDLS